MNVLNRKSNGGFTLMELVIVMVIIGILAAVSVPMYRGYTRRAMASEGRALLGGVKTAERIYLVENGKFLTVADINYSPELDIDARGNTYFRTFAVVASGGSLNTGGSPTFTATTSGEVGGDAEGITVTMIQAWNAAPIISVSGIQ